MNNINLITKGRGVYDWNFTEGNLDNVTGDQAIINEIKHAVLLQFNELRPALYNNEGTKTININSANPEEVNVLKTELTTQIKKIKHVNNCNIKIKESDYMTLKLIIEVIKDDGGVLTLGI